MATLNKVMLIGRLTDNPEPVRSLPSGGSVVKFRFAVGRSRKNPQTGQWENDPNPLFIDCDAFSRPDSKRNLPDLIARYAKKGDQLYIEGRLQLDQWEDKNGGGKRSKHKIVVDNLEFLTSRGGDGSESMGGGPMANRSGGGRSQMADEGDEYGGGGGSGSGSGGGEDNIPF
jgi:single-strand DNA-binding protein